MSLDVFVTKADGTKQLFEEETSTIARKAEVPKETLKEIVEKARTSMYLL